MGSVGAQLEDLKQRVANLRPYTNTSHSVQNALIYDKDKVAEILKIRDELQRKGKLPDAEVKTVFLDRVYTGQPFLYRDKLNDYVDKPIHELAEGFMYQGDVVVTDGNHRLALAKLNNQGTVRMLITELDKKKRRRK